MHFCCIVGMSVYGLWAVGTVRCCGKGSPNHPLLFSPMLPLSFFLPQHDINEATDETKRESHPGQHVGIAELCDGCILRTHHGVDDRSTHYEHTGQDLEDCSEEEASTLDQSEQLVEKCDEGEEAEEQGQDHEGLHCLDPVFTTSWLAVVPSIIYHAIVPQICAPLPTYRPGTDCC